MIEVGKKAPNFRLKDKDGVEHSLSDFLGKNVVLYFYPRDNTPGCTRQAIAYEASKEALEKENTVIIGISKDSEKSHAKFQEKQNLSFLMLCDEEHKVMEEYGVWQEKKLYGKVSMGTVRTTFVIDADGNVASVTKKVKPDEDAVCALEFVKSL